MKLFLKFLFVTVVVLLILGVVYRKKLQRLNRVNHLFDKENIVENFQDADILFDVSGLEASPKPVSLPKHLHYKFPENFESDWHQNATQEFLEETETEGLLIIHNDTIIYESYHKGLEPDETHISWSMSKSFISTLVGIAVDRGQLKVSDKVVDILPEFKGTGYDGVSVENLLEMSSGVKFVEDYADFFSDINRFGRTFAMGSSFKDFALSLDTAREPGTFNHYVSIDTQVLGLILSKVTGLSLTTLLKEWIWDPLGMEYPAQWIVDDTGFEMALGGLNATLRDFAKLGYLYLNDGVLEGKQIVSKEWVRKATTPHAPHLMPDQTELSSSLYGYGYQWWIPRYPKNDFFASGIYNQYVYVNRDKNLVIAKLSADYKFKTGHHVIKAGHIGFFQAIAETFPSGEKTNAE